MASLEHAARGRALSRVSVSEEINGQRVRTSSDSETGAVLDTRIVRVRVTSKARSHFAHVCDMGNVHRVPLSEWGERWQITAEAEVLALVLEALAQRGTLLSSELVLTVAPPMRAAGSMGADAMPKRRIPSTQRAMEQHERDTGRAHVPGRKLLPGEREGTLSAALLSAFGVPDTADNRASCLALVLEYSKGNGSLPDNADIIVRWLAQRG